MAVALTALGNIVALIEVFFRPVPHITPTFIVEGIIRHEIGSSALARSALAVAVREGDAIVLTAPTSLDEEITAGVIGEDAAEHRITLTAILGHIIHRNRENRITLVLSLLLVNHTEHRPGSFVIHIWHACQSGPIENASSTTIIGRWHIPSSRYFSPSDQQ